MRSTRAVNAICQRIRDDLSPGDRLPPEQALAREMGVSRSTVRDALARLAADGVVVKQWGVGTFVKNMPRKGVGVASIRPGIPGILATAGGTPSVSRFEHAEAPPDPDLFPEFPHSATLTIVRVFALDGVPAVAIRDRVIAEHDGARVDPEPLASPGTLVVDVLAAAGVDFQQLEIEMWAEELDEDGRRLFGVEGPESVIETRGVGLDANGAKILEARGTYRTAVIHVSLTVT